MNIIIKNLSIRVRNLFLVVFFLNITTFLFSFDNRNNSVSDLRKYHDILEKIQSGKLKFFGNTTYKELKNLIFFSLKIKLKEQSLLDYISGKTFDGKIVILNDLILGMKNKDPRVRLISINLLKDFFDFLNQLKGSDEFQVFLKKRISKEERLSFRSFDKKKLIQDDIKRYDQFLYQVYEKVADRLLEDFYLETVFFKRHCMINSIGIGEFRVPHIEIKSFLFELVRFLVDRKIKEEKIKPIDFEKLNPVIFYALTQRIKNETRLDLPIYKIENNIEILIHSLKHPKDGVQKLAAEFLSEVYHSDYTNNQIKNRIEQLQASYPLLKEAIENYHKRKALEEEMDKICPDYLSPSEEAEYIQLINWISGQSIQCP